MLTLITPTSDRPQAFALCERWMARQTYRGELQWIVADDGQSPTIPTMGQEYIRRRPESSPQRSFRANLAAALTRVQGTKVVFIEDDDWYAPDYLQSVSDWLDRAELVGEGNARYYNVRTKRYRTCGNRQHASLCQTALRAALIPRLNNYIRQTNTTFVDIHLWRTWLAGHEKFLRAETRLSCGMKGLPGKRGIGMGHRLGRREKVDETGDVLDRWVGPEDAAVYRELFV